MPKKSSTTDDYENAVFELFWDWYEGNDCECWTKEQHISLNDEAIARAARLGLTFKPRFAHESVTRPR